ncbi:unnamed protein product [Peronospora belbahrii]|uniref:Phosphoglycerate mutase n=1 Tax=Peronospora belbahrii TaxID=622444 RepID=A0ABN8CSV8_9STRA|nr:unnamed protein product [Peronospora belbahrii]
MQWLRKLVPNNGSRHSRLKTNILTRILRHLASMMHIVKTAKHFFPVSDLPFVCMENCREILGCHICDKRRSVSELKLKFPDVDFSAIKDEEDMLWTPTHRETDEEMQARAKRFLVELFQKIPEQRIAVVTHSVFMESINAAILGVRMHPANCEVFPFVLEVI